MEGDVPRTVPPQLPPHALSTIRQPDLAADGLLLRRWDADADAEPVRAAFEDRWISHWHARTMDSVEEARTWIGDWHDRLASDTDASWAVTEAGALIGYVALRDLDVLQASAQLSYWVRPEARGRQVAQRAGRAVVDWGFGELGLHRVWLAHTVCNPRSCRIATVLGLELEGTMRDYYRHLDGWHDAHLHARITAGPTAGRRRPASR